MSVLLPNIDINNDSWGDLIDRVNQLIDVTSTQTLTANGDPVTGDSVLDGDFYASNFYASNVKVATQDVTISVGPGLSGGGNLANAVISIGLSANTIASLTLANGAAQANSLANVAFSGSFNDLSDKITVNVTVPTGLVANGGPITSSNGVIAITYASGYEGFTTSLKNVINNSVQLTGAQIILGNKQFSNTTGPIGQSTSSGRSLEVQSSGANNASYITFHRSGAYACYFGLDTDNKLKWGGWSAGNNAYEIYHQGNFNPNTYLSTSGGTMSNTATIAFENSLGEKIKLYGNNYGFGIESGVLNAWAGGTFRFRTGGSNGAIIAELSSVGMTMATAPTSNNHLTNKFYVDNRIANTAAQQTTSILTQHSLTGGGNLSANRTLNLVGDLASPGNNKVYGTNSLGTRGWYDQAGGVGIGQTWQNVSGSRAINTAYQNTTGKPIQLSIMFTAGPLEEYFQVSATGSGWLNALKIDNTSTGYVALVIPNGWYYKISGGSITYWLELR